MPGPARAGATLEGDSGPLEVGSVLRGFVSNPRETLWARWNWKSAVLSASSRAVVFFLANLTAGPGAATASFAREFGYRALTSGFYGAMTQAFSAARPAWLGSIAAVVVLPLVGHVIEFGVHYLGGTPNLRASVGASLVFTACSTLFQVFAMRRGALIVGDEGDTLARDLRRMPRLLAQFLVAGAVAVIGVVRAGRQWPDRRPQRAAARVATR